MLEETERPTPWEGYPLGEDGLPIIPLDQAYHDRVAQRIKDWTGEYPLWHTASPQRLAEVRAAWLDRLAHEQSENPLPHIPLEYLRREHLYD